MSAPIPPPSITGGHGGPSSAADTGGTGHVGGMTVGDYYASGSRVRQSNASGWGWRELGILGVVAVAGWVVWRKL